MNPFKQAAVIATLFSSCTLVNMAISAPLPKDTHAPQAQCHQPMRPMVMRMNMMNKARLIHGPMAYQRSHNLGLRSNKQLTPQDARIIIKAALLQDQRPTYSVGPVVALPQAQGPKQYAIVILNGKKRPVSTVAFNSATGSFHPMMRQRSAAPALPTS